MSRFISHLLKMDWILITSSVLLSLIGFLVIYSSCLADKNFLYFEKQVYFFAAGIAVMFALSFLDWRVFRDNPYLILILYFLCVLLLLGLLIFAPEIRGVRSWYNFGVVSFDPIGFTAIILCILLAKFFSMRHVEMYRLSHIVLSGIYIGIPAFLIFRQPDMGSVIIIVLLWIGVLLVSGVKLRHFLVIMLCGILLVIVGWFFLLHGYQKERIMGYLSPSAEPLGAGWNQNQSKIAIGSGGLLGQGFGKGSQTQFGFLPETHTDFVYAVLAEEFGLTGVLVLFFIYAILMWRIIGIALAADSNFPRIFASGLAIIIMSQFFINIGMSLGVLPVIGIPLPFISYGGSRLIAIFAGLGVLQGMKTH